jgi:hypothetical protein
MNLRVSIVTAVCVLTVFPAVAGAQAIPGSAAGAVAESPWLKDRRYTEGPGYRVGNLEVHPGLAGEFGYDSNYLYRATDDTPGPGAALHVKITPSLSLSTLTAQRRELTPGAPPPEFTFRGGLSATYHELIPLTGDDTTKTALRNSRNLSGELDMMLGIMPGRPWSGNLMGSFARIVMPSEAGNIGNYVRDVPAGGAELIYTPGGGLLDWRLGYNFVGTLFEQQGGLTNFSHEGVTRGRWRFLPRTALMYDGRFGYISYPNGNASGKASSHPVRARIGINGLVTSSFSVLAMVGWGASFYSPSIDTRTGTPYENFDSLIGQAEVKYYLTPNPATNPGVATLSLSAISVGFTRDFADSYVGTFYERDRGYLGVSYFFSGQFLVALEGGAAAIRYPPLHPSPSWNAQGAWTDARIDASLFAEYRIRDSIGINTTFRYDGNISGTSLTFPGIVDAAGRPLQDHLSYNRFQAYLGVRWFM